MASSRKAFTLLEVLMTTTVIAVVSALAIPGYLRAVEKSRRNEAAYVLQLIRSAELRYQAEQRTFTLSLPDLDIEDPNLNASRHFDYWLADASPADFQARARPRNLPFRAGFNLTITRSGAVDEVPAAVAGVPEVAE